MDRSTSRERTDTSKHTIEATMRPSIAFYFAALGLCGKSTSAQTTCSTPDDCEESEFCAVGDVCTAYDCEGLYSVIKDQIEGIEGLECSDYSGVAEGVIYACDVTAGTSSGSAALAIDPDPSDDNGVVIQPFSRECVAAIPENGDIVASQFYCLDTKDADFETYLAAVSDSTLDCGDELPVHATTRFDLLTGTRPSVAVKSVFDSIVASSGFYAVIVLPTEEDSTGSGVRYPFGLGLSATLAISSILASLI